jgi:hypothetical protein
MNRETALIIALVIAVASVPVAYIIGKNKSTVQFAIPSGPQTRAPYKPRAEAAGEWHEIAKITGSAQKTTQYYSIPDDEWRVTWQTQPRDRDTNFMMMIQRDDGLQKMAANIIGAGNDSTYGDGAGRYRLEIDTSQDYEITIESKH